MDLSAGILGLLQRSVVSLQEAIATRASGATWTAARAEKLDILERLDGRNQHFQRIKVFTASQVWTVPAETYALKFLLVGGGAGGAAGSSGGRAGAALVTPFCQLLPPGTALSVSVAAGGAVAQAGGASSVVAGGFYLTAPGGASSDVPASAFYAGFVASSTDAIKGVHAIAYAQSGMSAAVGNGGASLFGPGGIQGGSAAGYGGGGAANQPGGPGIVVIWY